jgi:hypothetical protein
MHPVLAFLDGLARRLAVEPETVALLALGSAGRDRRRLDEHSDADFFVITGTKERLLTDLDWLGGPLLWSHRNSPDGYAALVGAVFCEFAVLLPDELRRVQFSPGRVVWARPGFDTSCMDRAAPPPPGADWLVQEILANLHVGLHRWLRGERLAAVRMVQGQALDNLLRMHGTDDPFVPARRAEHHGGLDLGVLSGGYAATPRSAEAILAAIPTVEGPMVDEVRTLLCRCLGGSSGPRTSG